MMALCPECGRATQTQYCERCHMHVPEECSLSALYNHRHPDATGELTRLGMYGNCGIYSATRKRIRMEPLAALTDRQKACFILRKFFGLSRAEIASHLNITETTVRTHIFNAMKRIDPTDIPVLRNIVVKQVFAWTLMNVIGHTADQTGKMLGIHSATVRQHVKREEDRRNANKPQQIR